MPATAWLLDFGVWPVREELFRGLPEILGVDGRAGLPGPIRGGIGQSGLWTSIGITELLLLVVFGWALKIGLDRWGPHRVQGMATRAEAEWMLGRTRLRKASAVVRPDLRQGAEVSMTTKVFDPKSVGWRIGRARKPRVGQLPVPWDRTTVVIGPQGSSKTPRPVHSRHARHAPRRAGFTHQAR